VKLTHLMAAAAFLAASLTASWAWAEPPDSAARGDAASIRLAQAGGDASRFQLGRHYHRLSPTQPTSSGPEQVEVAEVFWYGCPFCYAFQPHIERWHERKPDHVSFVRLPAVWNPLVRLHARAYYTAEELGLIDEVHAELFHAIHEQGNPLDSEQALESFFARFGVDAEEFHRAYDSYAVHTRLERAEELARRYRIASVPVVVINGRYTTDANMAGGYEQLVELIDVLAAREAARED
jgi:protein dithiol oxidoreductase (disulfide-forming)